MLMNDIAEPETEEGKTGDTQLDLANQDEPEETDPKQDELRKQLAEYYWCKDTQNASSLSLKSVLNITSISPRQEKWPYGVYVLSSIIGALLHLEVFHGGSGG